MSQRALIRAPAACHESEAQTCVRLMIGSTRRAEQLQLKQPNRPCADATQSKLQQDYYFFPSEVMSCNIIQLSGTRWDALGLLRKARKPARISQINFSCGSSLDQHCWLNRRETGSPLSRHRVHLWGPPGPTGDLDPAFKAVVLLEETRRRRGRRRKNQRTKPL